MPQRRHAGGERAFRSIREKVGRALLLGLELLVAADIIRTVSEEPTLRGVLALIRTFLSFTLAVEFEGHWPWRSAGIRGVGGPDFRAAAPGALKQAAPTAR